MKSKKLIVILSLVLIVTLLAGCGGDSGDALKGKWESKEGSEIVFIFDFDGKGKITAENQYGLNSEGSYTIDGDLVSIDLESWEGVAGFNYTVDGDSLLLDPVDEYRPVFDLQKK